MKEKTCLSHGYVMVMQRGHHRANGYGYVKRSVLVVEAKIGRRLDPLEHVHHINGDKQDDSPENLEALTSSEHAKRHNFVRRPETMRKRFLSVQGSASPNSKLKESDIPEIIRLRGIKTQGEIAAMFGVNQQLISRIQLRQIWKHVTNFSQ